MADFKVIEGRRDSVATLRLCPSAFGIEEPRREVVRGPDQHPVSEERRGRPRRHDDGRRVHHQEPDAKSTCGCGSSFSTE